MKARLVGMDSSMQACPVRMHCMQAWKKFSPTLVVAELLDYLGIQNVDRHSESRLRIGTVVQLLDYLGIQNGRSGILRPDSESDPSSISITHEYLACMHVHMHIWEYPIITYLRESSRVMWHDRRLGKLSQSSFLIPQGGIDKFRLLRGGKET